MRSVRGRISQVAARRASAGARDFLERTEGRTRIWLTLRAQGRTAVNLFDALLAVAENLLREDGFAVVLDGYSRPTDYATNDVYPRATVEGAIARETAQAHALAGQLAKRLGHAAQDLAFVGVGCDLLDSVHLAAHCRAYFAHHGTVQHKIGYFTDVPGMVHANLGILAGDPAGGHRHVIEAPGIVEYLDASQVDDIVVAGGRRLDPNNAYRFRNIPAVVAIFRDFLARQAPL
jgi:methylmalonyl-CoA mutase cobalamin-binding subunit